MLDHKPGRSCHLALTGSSVLALLTAPALCWLVHIMCSCITCMTCLHCTCCNLGFVVLNSSMRWSYMLEPDDCCELCPCATNHVSNASSCQITLQWVASACHACPNIKEACAHKCEHGVTNCQWKYAELYWALQLLWYARTTYLIKFVRV